MSPLTVVLSSLYTGSGTRDRGATRCGWGLQITFETSTDVFGVGTLDSFSQRWIVRLRGLRTRSEIEVDIEDRPRVVFVLVQEWGDHWPVKHPQLSRGWVERRGHYTSSELTRNRLGTVLGRYDVEGYPTETLEKVLVTKRGARTSISPKEPFGGNQIIWVCFNRECEVSELSRRTGKRVCHLTCRKGCSERRWVQSLEPSPTDWSIRMGSWVELPSLCLCPEGFKCRLKKKGQIKRKGGRDGTSRKLITYTTPWIPTSLNKSFKHTHLYEDRMKERLSKIWFLVS